MPTVTALDFESYYKKKEVDSNTLGYEGYFAHPEFEAYLLTASSDDGTKWVGDPRFFDWKSISGHILLSHNKAFDQRLYLYGVEAGWWPLIEYVSWYCTMDLCSYIGIRRALKGAVKDTFGVDISKETRDDMEGKRWADMTPEFQEQVKAYAIADSDWCLALWQTHSPNWPEWERELSEHNFQMNRRGIPVDEELLDKYIADLTEMRFELESDVPWTENAKLKSRAAFDAECRKYGLKPPKSLAKTDPAATKWFAEHEPKHAWIAAFRDVGRVNTLLLKYKTIRRQTRGGRFYPTINYAAAVTRRYTSGGGGVNMQNLSREELFGTKIRHIFRPRPGYKLVTADLGQIEIRTTLWLAGDAEMLNVIRTVPDVYEALAVGFEIWEVGKPDFKAAKDEEGKSLRQGTKTVGLGIQFGASAARVAATAKISEKEATWWREMFLAKFPKVPKLWKKLTSGIKKARQDPQRMYVVRLPSGNAMVYRNVRFEGGGIVCDVLKGKNWTTVRPWHGLLIENIAQSMARDVMCDAILRIEKAGWRLVFHVHDEVVIEVPEDQAEQCLAEVSQIMKTPPAWVPDIPLDCDAAIVDRYTK